MSDEVFSYDLDSPFGEDIRWSTIISESEAGSEQRYQKWLKPRRTFRVQLRARSVNPRASAQSEADQIWSFYRRHKGAFDSFLFQNPNENPVTAETPGSGDGVRSVFYVGNKVGIPTGDVILSPNTITLTRSVKGTGDYLPFTAFTVDEPIGQITTNAVLPSGDVLRANYNFRYRVRFKEDTLARETFVAALVDHGLELEEII